MKTHELIRSMLYVPGNIQKMIDKIPSLDADCFVLDLEDSVPIDRKRQARKIIQQNLKRLKKESKALIIVRTNSLSSGLAESDIAEAVNESADGIMLPKVEIAEDLKKTDELLIRNLRSVGNTSPHFSIFATIETARGLVHIKDICSSSHRLAGIAFGGIDLARDMGLISETQEPTMYYARSLISVTARAYEVQALDGVFTDFNDDEGFRKDCLYGKSLGFAGKTLIHPRQIAIANEVFSPSKAEVEYARKVVRVLEESAKVGRASASVDGKMIDIANLGQAKKIVHLSEIIEQKKREQEDEEEM